MLQSSGVSGFGVPTARADRPSQSKAIAAVHFDILAIAADGNRILTERVDRFVRTNGSEIAAAKLMGIFEVEGDKIVARRDYFDVNFATKVSADKRYALEKTPPVNGRSAIIPFLPAPSLVLNVAFMEVIQRPLLAQM